MDKLGVSLKTKVKAQQRIENPYDDIVAQLRNKMHGDTT